MDRLGLGLAGVLAGCGPVIGVPEQEASTTSNGVPEPPPTLADSGPTTHADDVTTDEPVPPPPMTTAAETTSTTISESDSQTFIIDIDGGTIRDECDVWTQDCPRGEKCMPWANDGGGRWNATRCSPIDPNPHDVGESCTVEGSGVSGIDDCVLGAMCFYVDESNEGECIAFCEGNEAEPTCDDACTYCNITGEGILTLCLPSCDPVAQDCDPGQGCYPANDRFTCAPDDGGAAGAVGEPCEFLNVCDPGTFCADTTLLPACEDDVGCCTPLCDAEEPDTCEQVMPGTVCVPWWEEGQEREQACLETGTVGACLLPQ